MGMKYISLNYIIAYLLVGKTPCAKVLILQVQKFNYLEIIPIYSFVNQHIIINYSN